MGDVFRFSCTACGACCNSPPSLYLNELLEQSAHFVLIPTFMFGYKVGPKDEHLRRTLAQRAHVDPGKDPEAFEQSVRTFTAESVAYGPPFPGGRNGEVLKISLMGLDAFTGEPCPKRAEDGRCQHYEGRPLICRAVPVHPFLTGPYRVQGLERFVRKGQQRGFKCDTSDEAPPLLDLENGKILDPDLRDAWLASRRGREGDDMGRIRSTTLNAYLAVRRAVRLSDKAMMELIIHHSLTGAGLSFGLRDVLDAARRARLLTDEELIRICENQIRLVDEIYPHLPEVTPRVITLSEGKTLKEGLSLETWRLSDLLDDLD